MPTLKVAPTTLKIPFYWIEYAQSFDFLLSKQYNLPRHVQRKCVEAFALCNDEKYFAKELLRRKKNLWLFRTNQQHFCGDFFIINMSASSPTKRKIYALDLKMGSPLKLGGGGAGIQFRNIQQGVDEIAHKFGIIEPSSTITRLTGCRHEMLAFFGIESV